MSAAPSRPATGFLARPVGGLIAGHFGDLRRIAARGTVLTSPPSLAKPGLASA